MDRLGIRQKILILVAMLIGVSLAVGGIGAWSLSHFRDRLAAMDNASARALVAEKINATILAIVMDSRGVYMARTAQDAEKFAKPMQANLDRLAQLAADWRQALPPARRAELDDADAQLAVFQGVRKETIRLGREAGPEQARQYGDNDANRKTRQQLNAAIEEQSATTGEITRNVQAAANGTQRVSENISQVSEVAHQTGDAAGRVLESSEALNSQSEVLRREVEQFLQRIRAA